MMSEQNVETRLIELETRLSFQDDTIQQLNSVITRQARILQKLEQALVSMQAQLKAVTPSPLADADQETPPPHY